MTSKQSAGCTLWVNRAIACVMAVLCVFLYDLLVWYRGLRSLPWQVCAVILIGFYLCTPAVMYALWCIEKLLGNILKEDVFIHDNVRCIRRIRWCCATVSVICLAAGFFYPPLLFLAVIMAFLAMVVSVVKNVMAAAVELREESDLTV